MATNKRMDDDEEMLIPGEDNSAMRQRFPGQPHTQQPYPGAAMTGPPTYTSTNPPFPPGNAVAMGTMPSGPAFSHNTTTVIVNQPPPPVVRTPRDWSSTMCSCCDDMGSCLLGAFCPMVLACQVAVELEESMCVPCCVPGWLIVLRTKLRAENNIQGTVMDDCCMTCWCGHCVLCQMSRELKHIRRSYQPHQ